MFLFQEQLSINSFGDWTEVPAYFSLKTQPEPHCDIQKVVLNLTKSNIL
jgi:hypothetical protein